MLQITNKTMLSTAIVLPVMNQFTIGKSSGPRKQYWRMTIPNSRVSLPDKLFTFAIFYTDNLCTMRINCHGQKFIADGRLHKLPPLFCNNVRIRYELLVTRICDNGTFKSFNRVSADSTIVQKIQVYCFSTIHTFQSVVLDGNIFDMLRRFIVCGNLQNGRLRITDIK